MLFNKIKRDIRALNRARYISEVFAKYGFGYILENINFPFKVLKTSPLEHVKKLSFPARVRKVFEELGPTFIKLGQMLSLRPDMIPFEFCQEFEKLQDQIPPVDFPQIKSILEKELNDSVENVFQEISFDSLASASLAQVHKARYKGKDVAVKVKKKDTESIIRGDLDILELIADYFSKKYPEEAKQYNLGDILKEFKGYIFKELDFKVEAVNIRIFKKNFNEDVQVHFPRVYKEISSSSVLVTELVKGIKIKDIPRIEEAGLDKKSIARTGAVAILKQIFIDGFFHGDPHPGNILVLGDSRICFLDSGVAGRLQEDTRLRLADIFIGVIQKDSQLIIDNLRMLGTLEKTNLRDLNLALMELLDVYHGEKLEDFDMAGFLRDLMSIIYKNKVKLLPDLLLLMKSIVIIEGIGTSLDPDFNVAIHTEGLVQDIAKKRYSPDRILRHIRKSTRDFSYFLNKFPRDLIEISNNLKQGELKIAFEHRNLDRFINILDKASNRISVSLLISALVKIL